MRFRIGFAVLMLATAITAYGQATPACGPDRVRVTAFNTERREPFSGTLTTIPPNPALLFLLPGLESGKLEIRERLVYQRHRHEQEILLTTFVIESDLPFPTSDEDLGISTIVEKATLGIKHIFTSCSPLPSLMFVGTVKQQSFPQAGDALYPGGWGVNITGATFAFSTGYTTQSNPSPPGSGYCAGLYPTQPPLFNVTESVAGVGVAWAPCAVGTLTFEPENDNENDDNNGQQQDNN
jgi:hypothetical protein